MTAREAEDQMPADEFMPAAPPPLPESPFSMTWRMLDPAGCEVQLTIRAGVTPDVITEVTRLRKSLLDSAQRNGWTFTGGKPVANAIAPTVPGTNGAAVPPPLPVSAPAAGGVNESACAMVEVNLSFTSKKPQLSFHVSGMDMPLRYTQAVEKMAALLAPLGFTAAHIVVGQKYSVNCIVSWRQGEKYRDVLSVRPA